MTISEITEKIKRYLPAFIIINEVLESVLFIIGQSVKRLSDEITALKDCYWTGKGLQLTAQESRILYNKETDQIMTENGDYLVCENEALLCIRHEANEEDLQKYLLERLNYTSMRGTESGVKKDAAAVLGIEAETVIIHRPSDCGIIVNKTYIGQNTAILNAKGVVEIVDPNIAEMDETNNLIKKYLAPIGTEIIYRN